MPHLLVAKILDGTAGIKKDGPAYLVAEEIDATAYVSLGQEVLQVVRLSRVEIAAEALMLTTHKGERFFFPPEQLVGLRLGGELKGPKSSAGFR